MRRLNTAILMVLGALLLGSGPGGCRGGGGGEGDTRELPRGVVVLRPEGRTVRVQVEVARAPEERQKGLMFRRKMPAAAGMLFVFEKDEVQSFWMKNTYLALDMIFIDKALKVVGTVQNAAPLTEAPRKVDGQSRYVLEVNAGFVARHGIVRGTSVEFEAISR